jgi:biopolymer transport protein ExbB
MDPTSKATGDTMSSSDSTALRFEELLVQGYEMWQAGGWAMIVLSVVALVMFTVGVSVLLQIYASGLFRIRERTWRQWLDSPSQRRGAVGRVIERLSGRRTIEDIDTTIDAIRIGDLEAFDRDLRVMKVCIGAAPLVGLLGTVTGMLVTFDALSTGSGGDKTMSMIAAGISEALITTETGLVIALPGLFFHFFLSRKSQASKRFVARLDSVCKQRVLKGLAAAS